MLVCFYTRKNFLMDKIEPIDPITNPTTNKTAPNWNKNGFTGNNEKYVPTK